MNLPWHNFHFVGVGGIGMSGLASILLELGCQVSGSDIRNSPLLKRLSLMGAKVYVGHQASNIDNAEVVIYSSAIKKDNPELLAAQQKNISILSRGELLALLMSQKKGIAVTGTHGKTTTSAMIATITQKAKFSPTVVVGGIVNDVGFNAWLGKGEYFVAEADESDGSFLLLDPEIAVVTNIDADHLDHYQDIEAIEAAFKTFVKKVKKHVVACGDDKRLKNIVQDLDIQSFTYGFSEDLDFQAKNLELKEITSFDFYFKDKKIGRVRLPLPGKHNVLNALATLAVAYILNVKSEIAIAALEDFKGVGRRLEIKGEKDGVLVIDDYAHHPAEINALLMSIRQKWNDKRIITVFQPHRYSRTKALFEKFLDAFNETDKLIVTEIYSAGEMPISGINGARLAQEIARHREVYYCSDFESILKKLFDILQPGDLLITVGAGNIYQIGEMFLRGVE